MWTQIRLQPQSGSTLFDQGPSKTFEQTTKEIGALKVYNVSDVAKNDQDSCKLKEFFLD